MYRHSILHYLVFISMIQIVKVQYSYAAGCRNKVEFRRSNSIFENVEHFLTLALYNGGKDCDMDFGPHLNRTDKKRVLTFVLVILCTAPTDIQIKNPSNIQRRNVISYLEIGGPCEVDLEGIAIYSHATDYRVQTLIKGAKMKTPNSTQRVRHLQSQINKIGTLSLEGSCQGIPNMYVKYNWSLMAEVKFYNLSLKHFPAVLKYSMPRLQSLELAHNELKVPPHFPWDKNVLNLPRNLTRKPAFNDQYQDSAEVQSHLYRRFFKLDFNKIQDLSRFEFRGHLKKLSIKGNGLKVIGRNCLVNLTGVHAIDLSINQLEALPEGIFRGQNSLLDLRLNDNKISMVHQDTFKDSTRLRTLYLNKNRLKKIPKGLLLEHEELESLHLENNLIIKVEHGALPNNSNKLKTLFMNGNKLQRIPSGVFLTRSLETIYLANNMISFKGIIETLDSIHLLQLGNALRKSVSDMSRELRSDKIYIDLTKNNVRYIDINDLDKEQRMKIVMMLTVFEMDLRNNPLLCDCKALNLTRVIKKIITSSSHVSKRRFRSWICAQPKELKGKEILTVREAKFVCMRNLIGCPVKDACSVRETDGTILVDVRNKDLKALPHSMPAACKLEIFLENNQITELGIRRYLGNVTVLHLSRNKIQHLNASFVEKLTNITTLKLDENELKRLPRNIKMLTSRESFVTLAIHSNYLVCDCHSKWIKGWLINSSSKISDIASVKCGSGLSQGKPIYRLPIEDFICEDKKIEPTDVKGQVIISITLGVLLVTSISVLLIVYFYRNEMKVLLYTHFNWHPFDRVDDSDPSKIYDAFISYSSHDRNWVHKELKHKLENTNPPFRICFHDRDFEVGATIHDNIIKCVNRSKRMIMVLSNSFLESEWCKLEFRVAHQKVLQDKTNYLIIILFEGVDTDALDDETKLYLRTNTYLSVTNKWFWEKLMYSLPKPRADVHGLNNEVTIELEDEVVRHSSQTTNKAAEKVEIKL